MARKPTRREFLTGKAASGAPGPPGAQGRPPAARQARDRAPETYLMRVARRAMACEFELVFNAGQYPQDAETALEALDLVQRLEAQLSFFRPASELSQINRTAATEPVEVEPGLFGLLELAFRVHQETRGAYDITATALWEAWGFSRRAGRLPSPQELAAAKECVGSHLVELDPEQRTVRFTKPGVQLNLGSIGKGYALDRCAALMASAGIGDYLFHGGHSSVLARGRRADAVPTPQGEAGWSVALRDPLRPQRPLAEVQLIDRALSTSGSGVQYFRHKGRRYGHILDPRTGWPAEGVLLATALAPMAALAEALSTAFYVLGAEATREYCRDRPEIGAILLVPAPSGTKVELVTVGLRPGELSAPEEA